MSRSIATLNVFRGGWLMKPLSCIDAGVKSALTVKTLFYEGYIYEPQHVRSVCAPL